MASPNICEITGFKEEETYLPEKEKEERAVSDEEEAELQQILQSLCLERETGSSSAAAQSLRKIDVKVNGKDICILQIFDRAESSDKSVEECRKVLTLGAQAKLRLLQAIGNCRTLREIEVSLTGKELETLLTHLQLNPVLQSLVILAHSAPESTTASDGYVERVCEILGRILHISSTLTSLRLYLWGLTATGAHHLASGLRGNADSALGVLYLHQGENSSLVKHVAEIVRSATRLRELGLLEVGVLQDDDLDALADALMKSTRLESLRLHGVVRGASALLQKVFTEMSKHSITSLKLDGVVLDRIGESLLSLLSRNQSLKELVWEPVQENLSPAQWQRLGELMISSSSFRIFRIRLPSFCNHREAIDDVEPLLNSITTTKRFVGLYLNSPPRYSEFAEGSPWFSSSEWMDEEAEQLLRDHEADVKRPICELHFDLNYNRGPLSNLAKALRKVTFLSSLYLQMSPRLLWDKVSEAEISYFLEAIRDSSSLRLLTIDGGNEDIWPGGWKKLGNCLHLNRSITHLRLIDCNDLDEHVFKLFMGVLRVNSTLKKIGLKGTPWETDGKSALIEEELRRNAALDYSYFSVFTRQGLPFHPATNGRLLFCGSPLAGETRLRQAMTEIVRQTVAMIFGSRVGEKASQLLKKTGREVKLFKDDEEMQIAIWDLADPLIFRNLQDCWFPQANHAFVFLYVFSPYDRENRCIKQNVDQDIKQELHRWLRIISSNSPTIGKMLPKVRVVISDVDTMSGADVNWFASIVEKLRREFHKRLDILFVLSENLYSVDSNGLRDVKDFIFHVFRDLLTESHIVPKVCSQMSSILAKQTKDIKLRPVWPSKDFYSFCFKRLQDNKLNVMNSLSPETPSGTEVFKAMASYLHDTGSIIFIPSLDQIIVDPNWLTNVFLGELIVLGHNFQGPGGSRNGLISSGDVQRLQGPGGSRNGFISSADLHLLLSSFLSKHPEFKGLDIRLLEELLIHFDLCYKVDSGEQASYYIPIIDFEAVHDSGETTGNRIHEFDGFKQFSWSYLPETNQRFIGFRVQCENPRIMSMPAFLYPRFQLRMHKLMTEMNVPEDNVSCTRDCMHLVMNGHEIFIERNMDGRHIDVMVKCSSDKPRDIAVKYINQHIIDELVMFCRSPKGCPGISVVVGILRTDCVKKLVPMVYRGDNQAVLIRELKENLEAYTKKLLKEIRTESWTRNDSSYSSAVMGCRHDWPSIPEYLPGSGERARELLPESEVESVRKNIQVKHEQEVKLLEKLFAQMPGEEDHPQRVGPEVDMLSLAPKRPYFTTFDVSCFDKYTAWMHLRKPLRLHFMCESMLGIHNVEDQPGFKLQTENMGCPQRTCRASWRVLYFFVKVCILNVNLGETVVTTNVEGLSSEEAWHQLQSVLEPHLRNKYTKFFMLHKVKYVNLVNLEDVPYAWVCNQCRTRGMQNGILECV